MASALSRREESPQTVFRWVLDAIPPAWQYPEDTTACIEYFGRIHALEDFVDTPWRMHSPISIWRTQVGAIEVHYKKEKPTAWQGPFLREEQELLDNIAHRVGEYLEWKQRELGGERLGAAPEHWRWRQRFAERIAASIDPARFGVQAVYLFGSTELGNAGIGSDIDLIVACEGDSQQERDLQAWLEGWSLCLAEISFQLYGIPSNGLLDARLLKPEQAQSASGVVHGCRKHLPGATRRNGPRRCPQRNVIPSSSCNEEVAVSLISMGDGYGQAQQRSSD